MYYHGSDTQITAINGGIDNGIYVTAERDAAASYGPIVHTLTLHEAATLADVTDIREAVEAVRWIDQAAGVAAFDPDDYELWALVEMTEVRHHLAAEFDGVELPDVTPDGDDHLAVLIWNTHLLSLAA